MILPPNGADDAALLAYAASTEHGCRVWITEEPGMWSLIEQRVTRALRVTVRDHDGAEYSEVITILDPVGRRILDPDLFDELERKIDEVVARAVPFDAQGRAMLAFIDRLSSLSSSSSQSSSSQSSTRSTP